MFQLAMSPPGSMPLLDLWIQHLLGLVLRVLMYLSLLLIVTVANELVTLRCASLSASASQERKQRGTVFEILLESISTLLLSELALFCRKLFPSTFQDSGCPRENVDAVTSFELSASTADAVSASTADAVLEFSVLTLVNVSCSVFSRCQCLLCFCTSLRCSATQSCLLDVSVRQCFLVFELLSCKDQSLL